MKELTMSPLSHTIGLDVADEFCQVHVLDEDGVLLDEGKTRTSKDALRLRFAHLPRARVVLEVGPHSRWMSSLLTRCGHDVLVANPRKLRLIYQSDQKDDRLDAKRLAQLGRLDPDANLLQIGDR